MHPASRVGLAFALAGALALAVPLALEADPAGAALAQAGEGVSATRALLALWLVYYAAIFAMAPLYAYKSMTTCRTMAASTTVGTLARPGEAESVN